MAIIVGAYTDQPVLADQKESGDGHRCGLWYMLLLGPHESLVDPKRSRVLDIDVRGRGRE